MKFSKKIVTLVVILNIVFTAAVLYIFSQVGNEPTVLIGCWFAFTTGELWMLSSIKKKEVSYEQGYRTTASGSSGEMSGLNQEVPRERY